MCGLRGDQGGIWLDKRMEGLREKGEESVVG